MSHKDYLETFSHYLLDDRVYIRSTDSVGDRENQEYFDVYESLDEEMTTFLLDTLHAYKNSRYWLGRISEFLKGTGYDESEGVAGRVFCGSIEQLHTLSTYIFSALNLIEEQRLEDHEVDE